MPEYDFIVIGGGPSGLTVAHLLTKLNAKILVIEREKTLGGCHRVKYVEG